MGQAWPKGERVLLREYGAGDLEAVQRYAGDRAVARHLIWGPNTREETATFLEQAAAHARTDPREQYELAVVFKDGGDLIGGARIGVQSVMHRRGDIGYVLRRDVWGQGIGTEVAGLLLWFGFTHLGLHRIEATCDPTNAASRRVLEKSGMRHEGLRRDDFLVRSQWRDSLLYSILEPEWTRRSAP